MSPRAYRSAGLARSLALLWTFLFATAAILAVGAVVLSSVLSKNLEDEALAVNAQHVAVYTDTVLTPFLVRGKRVAVGERALRRLRETVRARSDVTGVSIWSRKQRLVASTYRRRRSAMAAVEVAEVLGGGGPRAAVTELATRPSGSQRSRRQIVVWAPIRAQRGRPLGVAEVTIQPRILDASVGAATRTVWIAVAIVFAVLALALGLLVRGASARLSRQNDAFQARTRELLESTQLLEESLLQTVETLNAAVEARDPYTAGHSQRVRRVALAVGRDLGLPSKRLGALGTAALFHDVGKIGIPDSILTKAGPLEPVEAAIMREHVTRGAEIVAKVSSFEDAVPGDQASPRALGRPRLPGRAQRTGDPARGRDHRPRGRLGRDDDRPALRACALAERRADADPHRAREAVQPVRRRRVHRGRPQAPRRGDAGQAPRSRAPPAETRSQASRPITRSV